MLISIDIYKHDIYIYIYIIYIYILYIYKHKTTHPHIYILSLHPAECGGPSHCAREEISFFVCHVTSRDFVVRESCDLMGEFPSSLVTTLQSFLIIDLLEVEILSFQFFTWPRGQRVIMGEFPSSLTATLPSAVVIGLAEEEIFCFNSSCDLTCPSGHRSIV